MILALQDVVCGYGGGDVLQGLDLEVERGSITCIVGPNGAGKSTVLRAVSGLLRPRLGRIERSRRSSRSSASAGPSGPATSRAGSGAWSNSPAR